MGWLHSTLGNCGQVDCIRILLLANYFLIFFKGFLFLYVVYILVVILGRYVNQRNKRKQGIISHRNEFSSSDNRTVVANIDVNNVEHDEVFPNEEQNTINDEETNEERTPLMGGESRNEVIVQYPLSVVIKKAMRTFTKSEWDESNILMKMFLIIQVFFPLLILSSFFKNPFFLIEDSNYIPS